MTAIYLLLGAVLFIILSTAWLRLHPFLALLLAAFGYGLAVGMPAADVVASINNGFGGTLGNIGIVIAAGTIIGVYLEKSGGAYALAESVLKITGRNNAPLAMGLVGYVVSVPVFCDSGFVILSPLNKALCKRGGVSLAAGSVALALGLYATHTMVPPTPGPIAAAGLLNADLGLVILFGLPVSAVALLAGWLFAVNIASRISIDPDPEHSEDEILSIVQSAPSALHSILPILVPIALIVMQSIAKYPTEPLGAGAVRDGFIFLGSPVVALMIGVALAMTLTRAWSVSNSWIGQGLNNAAMIILITGAGGSFGKVLQNSGVADAVSGPLSQWELGVWLPFVLAAAIKTAQGSSTVAIITTATILSSMMNSLGFTTPNQIALTVVAIGAGSMCVSHANDSYFWVVTQFSRMDAKTGYKLHSIGSVVQALAAGVCVWLLSNVFG
ncbi:MAG: GntP family permease [Candidatus Hinthialibacter antarcticus]|nr:GntP family permease [Candidatus Hinthialibacter antarcticus]